MAVLNVQEQKYVSDYEEAKAAVARGERMQPRGVLLTDGVLEQMRVTAEHQRENAEARERWAAKVQAERKEIEDRATARHDEEVAGVIANFKARAQVSFPGTAAQFAEQWPTILADWQREQTRDQMDAVIARKRAELNSFL